MQQTACVSWELDSDGSGDGGVEEVERWLTRLAIKDLEKRNSRFSKNVHASGEPDGLETTQPALLESDGRLKRVPPGGSLSLQHSQ